jgi:hypothetical protein
LFVLQHIVHPDTPCRQGDQGGGIHELLKVDDCDSWQWAKSEWAGGILQMRVSRTHRNHPRRHRN